MKTFGLFCIIRIATKLLSFQIELDGLALRPTFEVFENKRKQHFPTKLLSFQIELAGLVLRPTFEAFENKRKALFQPSYFLFK